MEKHIKIYVFMEFYGKIYVFMDISGHLWTFMDIYGHLWTMDVSEIVYSQNNPMSLPYYHDKPSALS